MAPTHLVLLLGLLAAPAVGPTASLDALPPREEPGRLEEIESLLDRAEAVAPRDYGVLWRCSRLHAWTSDDPKRSGWERSRLGKKGWECGDRATSVNPRGVEGWFYAA